jgi:hypothetical protein
MTEEPSSIYGFLILAALILVHFVPTYIALARRHVQSNAIAVLNIVGGWTVIGWIVALVWAFTNNTR